MSKNCKPRRLKKFVLKVFSILNNPMHTSTIGWTDSGTSFSISNVPLFISGVLPKYFKHKNFSSFIRQLNMYGFHKLRDTGDLQVFFHPFFSKGEMDKLKFIQRKNFSSTEEEQEMEELLIEKKIGNIEEKLKNAKSLSQNLQFIYNDCAEREKKLGKLVRECVKNDFNLDETSKKCFLKIIQSLIGDHENGCKFN